MENTRMNKQEKLNIDDKWYDARPVLWPICLAAICLATDKIYQDIHTLIKGNAVSWDAYFYSVTFVIAYMIARKLKRKIGNHKGKEGLTTTTPDKLPTNNSKP